MPIFEKNPGSLTPTAGRAVSNFSSGLVRVDRKYVCTTEAAPIHRAYLLDGSAVPDGNNSPAIDGLFIHPTPNELEVGDGFTEFQISAYGRTKTVASGLILTPTPNYGYEPRKTGAAVLEPWAITYSLFEASGTICTKSDDPLVYDGINLPENILLPFNIELVRRGGVVIDTATNLVKTTHESWVLISLTLTNAPASSTFTPPRMQRVGIDPDGKPYIVSNGTTEPKIPVIAFQAVFSKDGFPNRQFIISTYAPQVLISNRSRFGKFEEISFTSKRPSNPLVTEVL